MSLVQVQSREPNFNSSLVQSVERRTVNPYVAGSSPAGGASFHSLVVQSVERRTVNPYVTGSSPVEGANLSATPHHLSTKNEQNAPKQCTIGGSVVSLLFRFSYPASIKHHKTHLFDFIAFYFFNSFLLHASKAL